MPAIDGVGPDYTVESFTIPVFKPVEWLVGPWVALVRAKFLGILTRKAGIKIEKSVSDVLGTSYQAMAEVTAPIKNIDLLKSLNETSKGNWVKIYEAGYRTVSNQKRTILGIIRPGMYSM